MGLIIGVTLQGIRGLRARERDLAFLLRELHQLRGGWEVSLGGEAGGEHST